MSITAGWGIIRMELIFVAEAGIFLVIMILWGIDIIRNKIWRWRWKRSDVHFITQIYRTPIKISPALIVTINKETTVNVSEV